jgi:hypothetical protein
MFSETIKIIFEKFSKLNNFSCKAKDENWIVLISKDFDILITYDPRESEISINFDLAKYFKQKKYPNELQFPLLLDLNILCSYLLISMKDFQDIATPSFQERIKVKYRQFIIAWNQLMDTPGYKDVLSEVLIEERKKLKAILELEKEKKILEKAHGLFKTKKYVQVVDLLDPLRDKLNEYYKKVLDYSLKMKG